MMLPSLAASLLISSLATPFLALVQAQAMSSVEVVYSTEANVEIATESAPYNTCVASQAAGNAYNYLTFAPYNATINFYTDANCQTFAFGLDGHYSDHPGAKAGSFRWVGWSKDALGLLNKAPFVVDPHALPPTPPPVSEPGQKQPLPPPQPGNNNHGHDSDEEGDVGSTRASSMFFGAVAGIAMIVSIGGLVFLKTRGKKIVDKGKGVLPYSRVSNSRDGEGDADILLPNRGCHNSFELEGEDDGDDDDDDEDLEKHKERRGLHHMSSSGSGSGSSSSSSSSNSGSSRNSGTYGRVNKEQYGG